MEIKHSLTNHSCHDGDALTLGVLVSAYAKSRDDVDFTTRCLDNADNFLVRVQGFEGNVFPQDINEKKRFILADDVGVSKNRNELLKMSDSEIVVMLDDDCVVLDDFANEILSFFKKNPDYNAVRFNAISKYKKIRQIKDSRRLKFLDNTDVGVMVFAFRKDFLLENSIFFNERIGPGTPYIQASEDTVFLKHFFRKGGKCGYISKPLIEILNQKSTWVTEFNERRLTTVGGAYYFLYGRAWPIFLMRYYLKRKKEIAKPLSFVIKYFYTGVKTAKKILKNEKK